MFIIYNQNENQNVIVSASLNEPDGKYIAPNQFLKKINDTNLFFFIIDNLVENSVIKFPLNQEITLNNIEILNNQENTNDFFRNELVKIFIQNTKKLNDFMFFEFSYLNNYFNSKGFFITNENKDEVYIKILETENDEMITNLERYLQILEPLTKYREFYHGYNQIYNEILECENENEKIKMIEKYKRIFDY